MRIGIDFDNTIACYDGLCAALAAEQGLIPKGEASTKAEVKRMLLESKEGMTKWQRLQGQMYGPYMKKADLYPCFPRFLFRCKLLGHEIFIVSHKTEYGHFDETKTPLRQASIEWMREQGLIQPSDFGIDPNNIFFESTRDEKVIRIKKLNLDLMIDDLAEVLLDQSFPDIRKILFNEPSPTFLDETYPSWDAISNALFGSWTNSEAAQICECLTGEIGVSNVERVKHGANSEVFKVSFDNGSTCALKIYPDRKLDPRPRMKTESVAFEVTNKTCCTPKVIATSASLDVAVYSWLEGKKIDHPTDDDLESLVGFMIKLRQLSKEIRFDSIAKASESCTNGTDLFSQIQKRRDELRHLESAVLNNFLFDSFDPCFSLVQDFALDVWPHPFEKPLSRSLLTLSPSDFGFHNAIRCSTDALCFFDFEYFGWDDPVKVIADLQWHPGMSLTRKNKAYLTSALLGVYSEDLDLPERLRASWALYGLRWALILLNVFKPWKRNDYVHGTNDNDVALETVQHMQLRKSESIINLINQTEMRCPYV